MKYFLGVCLLLAGCAKPSGPAVDAYVRSLNSVVPDTQNGWQAFSTYGNITVIVPVTMSDGTRCVVATGNGSGKSISCDWSKTK